MGETVKLTKAQGAGLLWANSPIFRRWSGVMKRGCPSYATMNALLRRGLIEQDDMIDAYRITPAGRAALQPTETPDV